MKQSVSILLAIYLQIYISSAQTLIPANTLVSQNFDGMATGLPLPVNWRISPAGAGSTATWATGLSSVTQAANSGAPATGGAYNWGTTAGTDRAVGFMSSGGYASPNAIMAFYRNTTGATVTSVTIAFSTERYRVNTSVFNLSFFSSSDGSTWTARTAGDIGVGIFATGASAYTFGLPQSLYKSVTLSGLSIPNNGDIYFRWVFSTGASNSQGLGIDNISIYAGVATPVILAQLVDTHILDAGTPGQVNPGDELRYTTRIKNIGSGDANNVVLTQPAPANTTLVPGSVRTSALAKDETYNTPINTPLSRTAANGVLLNDFGLPFPVVASFGPTSNSSATTAGIPGQSDNGGTLTVNADGSFNYTPPSSTFTGIDRFSYKATNGNAPDNDAIVTITIGDAPAPVADAYTVIGNVQINPSGAQNLFANDGGTGLSVVAVNGSASNVGAMFVTANGSNITVSANGDFIYNPGPGFDGPEIFNYTVDNGFAAPQTVNVSITINGMVWFVTNGGAAGDGRLTSPFNSIGAFQAVNNGTGNNPNNNDNIFIYESATSYVVGTTPLTLRTGQRLVGQDASSSLTGITGLTPNVVYSLQFPVMNATAGQTTTLTTTAGGTNAINLGSGNTIRGLTVGATIGSKIFGNNFGSVTIGDNTTADVTLSGAGQALNLTTGTFTATSGFVSVASTSSTGQGISMAGVASAGTVNFGSTSISGSTTQGILIGTTTANINFGNTIVNGGTEGVSLQNNSSGTRTFGTLTITSTAANSSFVHGAAGGTTVAGVTTISNATGTGIDIQNSTTAVSFGATTIAKSGAGTAVNINGSNGNVTFGSVTLGTSVARLTGPAVVINGGTGTYNFGTVSIFTNTTTAFNGTNADGTIVISAGTIDATGGSAIVITGPAGITTLNVGLSALTSNGGTNNVSFVNCGGTVIAAGGALTGTAAGPSFNVNGGSVGITYSGGITQTQNAAMVSVAGAHTGTINFNTGTYSATNGTGLQFDNADGIYNFNSTTSLSGGDAGVDILNGSGGTFGFSSTTSITNPSGIAFNVGSATVGSGSTCSITYSGTITKNSAGRLIEIQQKTGGTVSFAGALSGTSPCTGINLITNTGATLNFNGGIVLNGALSVFSATGGGTVNVTGTTNTIGTPTAATTTALTITNTTIGASNVNFRTVSTTGAPLGININTTGSSGGLLISGDGGGANNGSGGIIQTSTGNGINLISTSNASIGYMNINSNGDMGMLVQNNTNLTINRCNLSSNGNSTSDDGILIGNRTGTAINGVTGSLSITNTVISASAHNNLHMRNVSGTLTSMTVTGSSFNNISDVTGANAFLFEASNTAIITAASITSCIFNNNSPQRALEIQAHDNANIQSFTVQTSSFNDNGIHMSYTQDGNANFVFKVLNNTSMLNANPLQAINIFSSATTTGGTFQGRIEGNIIGNNAVAGSGSTTGSGIRMFIQGNVRGIFLINNNQIYETPASRGIDIMSGAFATNGVDVTITNNTIDHTHLGYSAGADFPVAAIYLVADNPSGFGNGTLRADVRGNTIPTTGGSWDYPTFDGNAPWLYYYEEPGLGNSLLVDFAPTGAPSANAEIIANNPAVTSKGAAASVGLLVGSLSLPPL